jgi:hypothetical protein
MEKEAISTYMLPKKKIRSSPILRAREIFNSMTVRIGNRRTITSKCSGTKLAQFCLLNKGHISEGLIRHIVRMSCNNILLRPYVPVTMLGTLLLSEKDMTLKQVPPGIDLSQLNANGRHWNMMAIVYENHVPMTT